MTDELDPTFLPYAPLELLQHFVDADREGKDPERHLNAWRKRIRDAPDKDAAFLERDETLWTAGALLAVQRAENSDALWTEIMSTLFDERGDWPKLIQGESFLYFEVWLGSPETYRRWLSKHLPERHPLRTQVESSSGRRLALERPTHLDAMLIYPESGFAAHFEAKVLSDIDTKTKHDALRNQLARNLDCMLDGPRDHPVLGRRTPDRSFLVLLTPELFRKNRASRLYGHLVDAYMENPTSIQRDLPHRELSDDAASSVSERIGWLTFEDIRRVQPDACKWLDD